MAGKFASAASVDTLAIRDAIFDIAMAGTYDDATPFAWTGGSKGRMPYASELNAAGGFPYLVVENRRLVGSEFSGGLSSGIRRTPGAYYPTYEFDVFAIYMPYEAGSDQSVLDEPIKLADALVARLQENYTLNQTCDLAEVVMADPNDIRFVTSEWFQSIKLTVRVQTQAVLDNTPA